MIIIKLTKNNSAQAIKTAVQVLRSGGVVVYPTETAYGLGADFFNQSGIKKVYQIKGRNFTKPLSVIVSSLVMAKKLVKFNKSALQLANQYWPGPLTLVLPTQSNFKTTLALRISGNQLAKALVKKLGRPLSATSANLSGKTEIYSAVEVIKQFAGKKYQPDLIIDAGKLPKIKVSTIVKVIDNKIEILRQGAVKV